MPTTTYTFTGMNNVADPASVGKPVPRIRQLIFTEMVDAVNVDLSDSGKASRRKGQVLKYSGNVKHLWANKDICLLVEDHQLKRLLPDYTAVYLLTLSDDTSFACVDINGTVVFSTKNEIGTVINGVATLFDVPPTTTTIDGIETPTNRIPTPAGHLLEYFGGVLYVFRNNLLYYTDPYDIESVDERDACVTFDGPGKMVLACDTGLWVSAGDKTYYKGDEEIVEAAPYAAIPGTAIKTKAELFGIDGLSGTVVVWASDRGVCLGGNNGFFLNLSLDKVSYNPGQIGTALLREIQGQAHYLAVLRDPASSPYNAYSPKTIDVDVEDI